MSTPAPAPAPTDGKKDDYLDKGVAAAQKKFGGKYGVGDPNKTKATNEKITDAIRKIFEKLTGKKVPASVSN